MPRNDSDKDLTHLENDLTKSPPVFKDDLMNKTRIVSKPKVGKVNLAKLRNLKDTSVTESHKNLFVKENLKWHKNKFWKPLKPIKSENKQISVGNLKTKSSPRL